MKWKLRKDQRVWKGEFSNGDGKKLCYLMAQHVQGVNSRVGTATEKARVPVWVLTVGANKWKPGERIPLGLGARESMEDRYKGSPEERVW